MERCSNQIARDKTPMKYSKQIIGCAFVIACVTSSASAMLQPLGKNCARLGARYLSTVVDASNYAPTLSDRFQTYNHQLIAFSEQKMPFESRNEKVTLLKAAGSAMFREVVINTTDLPDVIDEKTTVAKGLFDLQSYIAFVSKEDVISACNQSIVNKIGGSPEHVRDTMEFVEMCVHYPFPLSSRVTHSHIATSLSILERSADQKNQELLNKITRQAKENHGLSLIGTHGGGCGAY